MLLSSQCKSEKLGNQPGSFISREYHSALMVDSSDNMAAEEGVFDVFIQPSECNDIHNNSSVQCGIILIPTGGDESVWRDSREIKRERSGVQIEIDSSSLSDHIIPMHSDYPGVQTYLHILQGFMVMNMPQLELILVSWPSKIKVGTPDGMAANKI